MKSQNVELRKKVKRYIGLIEEQKVANERAEAEGYTPEDLNE